MAGDERKAAESLPDWPIYGWADDVRPALAAVQAAGRPSVLATLHTIVGGAPRPAGSQMLIADGQLHGYMSGGCIEGDIAARAVEVLASGAPQRLVYGEGGPFADIQLVCGGRVEILLEAIPAGDPATRVLLDAFSTRQPALWASDGRARRCTTADAGGGAQPVPANLGEGLAALDATPQAGCVRVDGDGAVALRCEPGRRLVVVGQDPTALAIAALGAQSGFETHLVRPKGPATAPPLAGVAYHREAAEAALCAIGLDRWSYVAVATHALEADEDAILAALPSRAAYIGVLGARRRLPERLDRLRARGAVAEDLDRLHAPIGLDIGGKAPFEIAVSVMAEIMAEAHRRRPSDVLDVRSPAAAAA